MKVEEHPERRARVIRAETGDDPEPILEAVRAARADAALERIVLDLRGVEGLGLSLVPGNLLPPDVWEEVQESYGVDPDEAPIDRRLALVLDDDGLRSAGYLGYEDYWPLVGSQDEALGWGP